MLLRSTDAISAAEIEAVADDCNISAERLRSALTQSTALTALTLDYLDDGGTSRRVFVTAYKGYVITGAILGAGSSE